MEEEATFCDACKKIASFIDHYYKCLKASYNEEGNLPFSPKDLELNDEKISLGTLKDLQRRIQCRSCQDIARTLVQSGREPPAHVVMVFRSNSFKCLSIHEPPFSAWTSFGLHRLEIPNKMHEVGRLFDPQQVNVELLRQWIHCCQTSHGEHCHEIEIPNPLSHVYLIDVVEGCLISANIKSRYIALSYVWGDFRTIQTTKRNLIDLQRPGSIDVGGSNFNCGKTIEDTLRLVSLMGERYLWVDCLCIVQDDLNTKQSFLNAMGSIYANAYFTIVAAEGNHADHGLSGLGRGSQARSVSCNIIRFPSGNDVIIHRPRTSCTEDSPWESRGWTFQEALFSRRLLIFNGIVSWFCRAVDWEEHVRSPTEDVAYSPVANSAKHAPFAARTPRWPDIARWEALVEKFNTRKLTFDEDVMDASAGLTSIFESCFSGGILWGIPEMFFDICIIWTPVDILRRRRAYNHALLAESFPSWSWVAWEGNIALIGAFLDLTHDADFEFPNGSVYTRMQPLAHWYKSRAPTSSLYPVMNIDHGLRVHHANLQMVQLPTGWTQGQYPDGTLHFTYETVPEMRFRYPMPLKNETAGQSINEIGRYLHFMTQRTWLFLGREIVEHPFGSQICIACLCDSEGRWAGSIRLNTSRHDSLPRGQSFELIALSLAMIDNRSKYTRLDEWNIPERPRDSEFYHYYYVMWVEWTAGIAYRKAIGTVYKPAWERQVREDINVILG